MRLIHKRPEGEVAAAGAPKGKSSGAGAKPEQPVLNKPSHSLLATSSLLKLFSLFVKHFHVPGNCGPRSSLGGFRPPAPALGVAAKRERRSNWRAPTGWGLGRIQPVGGLSRRSSRAKTDDPRRTQTRCELSAASFPSITVPVARQRHYARMHGLLLKPLSRDKVNGGFCLMKVLKSFSFGKAIPT